MDFSAGLAAVQVAGKIGFINTMGQFVIEPQFQKAGSFSDSWAWVQLADQFRYIAPNGEFLKDPGSLPPAGKD
ncbi:MAG: WG repeat-containing protein [Leptolyngbyaceae cyanobacterium CSU_1_4]|nr:WG repeat-containing protein [Leptolyngbyaceae cyanobacterium CSU_1_4]